jgi:hypothetical protein
VNKHTHNHRHSPVSLVKGRDDDIGKTQARYTRAPCRAATSGVLFRDAEAIERLRTVDTVIVDKTGTLTEGKPSFQKSSLSVAGPKKMCCERQRAWIKEASTRWPMPSSARPGVAR